MLGRDFLLALQDAGIVSADDLLFRVVIDASVDSVVSLYVERKGDERLLQVVPSLTGVKIRRSGSGSEPPPNPPIPPTPHLRGVRPPPASGALALYAADLQPDPADLVGEHTEATGVEDAVAPYSEAWLMALKRARTAFRLSHLHEPQEIVFSEAEARRVASLPQVQELAEKYTAPEHVLPCGLPSMLRGLRVVIK